jgi:hypothetical protein
MAHWDRFLFPKKVVGNFDQCLGRAQNGNGLRFCSHIGIYRIGTSHESFSTQQSFALSSFLYEKKTLFT